MRFKKLRSVIAIAAIGLTSVGVSEFAVASATVVPAAQAKPAASTDTEIAALFAYLEKSGCEFNRNGSWYSGADAVTHLRKKLDYLQGKKRVTDTESFITQAASSSSSSGKNYEVRCKGLTATPSGDWFKAELAKMRKTK